jgi:ribonuclease P protein component
MNRSSRSDTRPALQSHDASASPIQPPARTLPAQVLVDSLTPSQIRAQYQIQSLTGARLQRHADYQRAYAGSRKRQSASMSWFLARQTPAYTGAAMPAGPRVGLTAGKVLGKAHERNRIKRRMREVLRRHTDMLPAGFDLILHPRRFVMTMEFGKLEAEIVRILHQARAEAGRMSQEAPESKTRGLL